MAVLGNKGAHFKTALRAGDAQGGRCKILIGPGLFGGSYQNIGDLGAHQFVYDIIGPDGCCSNGK